MAEDVSLGGWVWSAGVLFVLCEKRGGYGGVFTDDAAYSRSDLVDEVLVGGVFGFDQGGCAFDYGGYGFEAGGFHCLAGF